MIKIVNWNEINCLKPDMITFAKRFLLCSAILILWGCKFVPSDIPMSDIKQPVSGASIEIKLTPEMDTLRIAQPLWINYSINTDSRKIYSIKVQLDTTILNVVQDNDVRTWLDPSNLYDGWHNLYITVYTATNSGSIADKLNTEAFVYNLYWPVYINNHARDKLKFYPVLDLSGGIKLSWPEYHYADFSSYQISWSSARGNGSKLIYDPHHNYLSIAH
jgi:hypothetical protein